MPNMSKREENLYTALKRMYGYAIGLEREIKQTGSSTVKRIIADPEHTPMMAAREALDAVDRKGRVALWQQQQQQVEHA